jgi:hypothetical protein
VIGLKFEKPLFQEQIPEKMVKQITSQKNPKLLLKNKS